MEGTSLVAMSKARFAKLLVQRVFVRKSEVGKGSHVQPCLICGLNSMDASDWRR